MNPIENANTNNAHVRKWVSRMAELCLPDAVHWFDGSEAE
jgi:phosphoenolpyruvate carboxykinase (GTP)